MVKKASANFSKVPNIIGKTQFVQLELQLLESPAWRAQSINCRRLIDFLMIENMKHAGTENGNLVATYNEIEKFGIHRKFIFKAIKEAEALGLILVEHGARISYSKSHLNRFTLTFCKIQRRDSTGRYWVIGSHNWQHVTAQKIANLKKEAKKKSKFAGTNVN